MTVSHFPESVLSAKLVSNGSSCEADCIVFTFVKSFNGAPQLLSYGHFQSITDYLVC